MSASTEKPDEKGHPVIDVIFSDKDPGETHALEIIALRIRKRVMVIIGLEKLASFYR